MKRLIPKTFSRFSLCCLVLYIVTAPLFYLVTKLYYAEDLAELANAVSSLENLPPMDLENDIMEGMMLQYLLIFIVVSMSLYITMRFVAKRIWRPFEDTLHKTEEFNLSQEEVPTFSPTDVLEFERLNKSLQQMMLRSTETYRIRKEYTENASHELLTPLAVMRSKLDLLMQEELTGNQPALVADLYELNTKMEHLNRNLLLLAKIESSQYDVNEEIVLYDFVANLLPSYNLLKNSGRVVLQVNGDNSATIRANVALLECMLNNLIANALRHTQHDDIVITISNGTTLSVSNHSDGLPLKPSDVFRRFYTKDNKQRGSGLGLAIVKAICDFHNWGVKYTYSDSSHIFTVAMCPSVADSE